MLQHAPQYQLCPYSDNKRLFVQSEKKKKIQIKTTIRYHYTYQNSQNPEHEQHQRLARIRSNRNNHPLLMEMPNSTVFKGSLMVPYKPNMLLLLQYSNHILFYLFKGVEIYVHTKASLSEFITALFIIVKTCIWQEVLQQVNK